MADIAIFVLEPLGILLVLDIVCKQNISIHQEDKVYTKNHIPYIPIESTANIRVSFDSVVCILHNTMSSIRLCYQWCTW